MVAAVSRNSGASKVRSQEARDTSTKKADSPSKAPSGSSSTPEPQGTSSPTPRPTVASAEQAREAVRQDTGAQQTRQRLDVALDGDGDGADATADAPFRASERRAFRLAQPELTAGDAESAPPEGFVENDDGTHTFRGTSGDDRYSVAQDVDGNLTVTNDVTGDAYDLTADEVDAGVRIWTAGGDDRVTLDASVSADLTLHGGLGDDRIDASAASGDLTIGGGAGDDVLIGGRGDDDIDGHSGDDTLRGGRGRDALAGGAGDDALFGQAGNDQLMGQSGDDRLYGGDGHDFVMGGAGADRVDGGTGGDALYADTEDNIHAGRVYDTATSSWVDDGELDMIVAEEGSAAAANAGADDVTATYDPAEVEAFLDEHPEIVINGTPEFIARTQADLGVMLGTDQGQGLLTGLTEALQDNGENLTIEEKPGEPGGTYSWGSNRATVGQWATQYSDGTNRMPLPALFHELVHGYQDLVAGRPSSSSTFGDDEVKNTELQATGLPWINWFGLRRDGSELDFTDNKFRAELGLPERSTYSGELGPPDGVNWNLFGGDSDHGHG